MTRKIRTLLLALAVVAVLAVIGGVVFTASQPAPLPPLPNPNGYDDFVKAGSLISDSAAAPHEMERETLRGFVLTNAESLRLARVGLSRTCSVPTAEVLTNFGVNDLVVIKRLAQLFAVEGRLAEMEGRTNTAARCYMDAIRLGNEVSRGGVMIHRLVGIACEAIGYERLAKLVPGLNCVEARSLTAELDRLDKTAVTWEEVWRLERVLMRHEMLKRINPIAWAMEWWPLRSSIRNAEQKHNRIAAHLRLLTTELALRCYQSDQGRVPLRLEELVPKYLKRVPSDPFSGQSLVYCSRGTNWLLYSIGPNRVDDAGLPAGKGWSNQVNNGDLFFDSPL